MATRKKKKSAGGQALSPERLIRERMRGLEIGQCYCNQGVEQHGRGIVIVSRKHTGGRISFCCFLLDTFCLGITDVFWQLREEEWAIDDMLNGYHEELYPCDYNTAHNWVYGALAWAADAGIGPCRKWDLAQYFLEEDTEDFPILDLPFGREGKHFLVAHAQTELNRYLPLLQENLGDDFDYIVPRGGYFDDYDDDEDYPEPEYSYRHPEFPARLDLIHPEVSRLLEPTDDYWWPTIENLNTLLALPHDELRADLCCLLAYTLGRLYDGKCGENEVGLIENAALLLGEVGSGPQDLDLVLEILRLPQELYFEATSDFLEHSLVPAIYKLGSYQLDALSDFILQPRIGTIGKIHPIDVVAEVALQTPERRGEVITAFSKVLQAAHEEDDSTEVSPDTLGYLVSSVVEVPLPELLSEIRLAFDAHLVDRMYAGDYEDVEESMSTGRYIRPKTALDLETRIAKLRQIEQSH